MVLDPAAPRANIPEIRTEIIYADILARGIVIAVAASPGDGCVTDGAAGGVITIRVPTSVGGLVSEKQIGRPLWPLRTSHTGRTLRPAGT